MGILIKDAVVNFRFRQGLNIQFVKFNYEYSESNAIQVRSEIPLILYRCHHKIIIMIVSIVTHKKTYWQSKVHGDVILATTVPIVSHCQNNIATYTRGVKLFFLLNVITQKILKKYHFFFQSICNT